MADNEIPVETIVENAVENDSEAEIVIDPDKAMPSGAELATEGGEEE
jgi:hypothetical protein